MRIVLDTSAVLGSDPGLIGHELAVSTATLAELHFGVLVATDPAVRAERLRRLADVERAFETLPVDQQVARSYGRIAAAVAAAGRQPRSRTMDLLIAATAHAHGAALATRNPDDLRGLEGIVDVLAL